jgi:hypothetical protein
MGQLREMRSAFDLTTRRLNGYAVDMGFESETERLQMIVDAPESKTEAIDLWLATDGTKKGLLAILMERRASWQTHSTAKPCKACRVLVKGSEQTAMKYHCVRCSHFHTGDVCPEVEEA